MNRNRFHDILHSTPETTRSIIPNPNPIIFPLKTIRNNDTYFSIGLADNIIGFEEKDKVDILYDLSCNYFYLSPYPWEKQESLEQENIHLSEIYVGDYQEKDMYYTNPLLEER